MQSRQRACAPLSSNALATMACACVAQDESAEDTDGEEATPADGQQHAGENGRNGPTRQRRGEFTFILQGFHCSFQMSQAY